MIIDTRTVADIAAYNMRANDAIIAAAIAAGEIHAGNHDAFQDLTDALIALTSAVDLIGKILTAVVEEQPDRSQPGTMGS